MEYFYLKIGTGNEQPRDWLAGQNPLGCPVLFIFQ